MLYKQILAPAAHTKMDMVDFVSAVPDMRA